MSERASLSPHHRELMLSLAYLGGLTYALALRLLPCYSERTLQRDLADLRRLGDVEKHAIYRPGPKGRSVKQYDVWTLTDKGHSYIGAKTGDQYPNKPTRLRNKRVMPHDLLAVKTIVALVERARQEGLSGLFVQFETRLNPAERRPIPDAVVIMQFGGGFDRLDIVPWTKDPAIEDEARSRFVIEVDYQTETLSVIAGKARAYRAAFESPEWLQWWSAQFGPRPIIIWVVADKGDDPRPARQRLASIYEVWDGEWPEGYWVGTTEYWMTQEIWGVHTVDQSGWFKLTTLRTERRDVTRTRRPALPAASSQQVAQRTTAGTPTQVVSREQAAALAARAERPRAALVPAVVRPATAPACNAERPGTVVAPDTVRPAAAAVSDADRPTPPAPSAPPVIRLAPPLEATVVSLPRAVGNSGHSVTVLPSSVARSADESVPVSMSSPLTWLLAGLEYVSPLTILAELLWACSRLALLLQDAYDEVSYAVVRLLEVLGIVWMARTSVWLIRWFFWEEGYMFVGGFVCLLVGLGGLGWIGRHAYRTYQADPLFSFSLPAPAPTAVAVIPHVPAPQTRPDVAPPTSVQPTLRPMCGVGQVVSEGLNLRETPGGRVLTVLVRGQEVVLLCGFRQQGRTEWVYVRRDNHIGWVSGRYLNLPDSRN